MQKEIRVKDIEDTINNYASIDEPIIVKRDDKEDLIIMSVKEYEKKIFLAELQRKLEEGEEDIKENKVHDAREVLKKLKEEYGY